MGCWTNLLPGDWQLAPSDTEAITPPLKRRVFSSHDALDLFAFAYTSSTDVGHASVDRLIKARAAAMCDVSHVGIINFFTQASNRSGGKIEVHPHAGYLPCIIGTDGEVVPVFELVEAIDGVVDYADIKEELPNLTFADINCGLMFLRRLAQFNTCCIDIDGIVRRDLEDESSLITMLRTARADREISRVLHRD